MANDFLSFLVDETLKLQRSSEVDFSSLELKLRDYELSFLKGEFIPQVQVLRFISPFGLIDVPVNWSIFSMDHHPSDYSILDDENDRDHLFKVLRFAWNSSIERLLVTHADGFCYIVGLKAGDDGHLHDLLNPQEWLKAA
jgi:hypothetical protein